VSLDGETGHTILDQLTRIDRLAMIGGGAGKGLGDDGRGLEPGRRQDQSTGPPKTLESRRAIESAEVVHVAGTVSLLHGIRQGSVTGDIDPGLPGRGLEQHGDALLDRQTANEEETRPGPGTGARVGLQEVRDDPDAIRRETAVDHQLAGRR
jgi:hypothetical protein